MQVVLIALFFAVASTQACTSDSQCSRGHCGTQGCICPELYSGSNCEVSWRDLPNFSTVFWVGCAFAVVLFSITFGWSALIIWQNTYVEQGKRYLGKNALGGVLLLIASFGRIFYYLFDPHSYRDIAHLAIISLLFYIPPSLWVTGIFVGILQGMTILKPLQEIRKIGLNQSWRKKVIILCLVFVVVRYPLIFWNAFAPSEVSGLVGNIMIGVVSLIIGIVAFYFVVRVVLLLKEIRAYMSPELVVIYHKHVYVAILGSILIPFSVVTVGAFVATGAATKPWHWVTFLYLGRFQEFLIMILMLGFIHKISTPTPSISQSSTSMQLTVI